MRLYPHQDVKDFHQKFGLIVNDRPVRLTKRKLIERIQFMQEELDEFAAAAGIGYSSETLGLVPTNQEQSLAGQADALVDLVYVAYGTAVMLGLPWNELWDDVHRANMAKVRGTTHRGHAVDVTKPEGWQPPMTEQILDQAGYDPKAPEVDDAV